MRKVRVGLVGTGFAGRYHVECLRRLYGVDVQLAAATSLRAESRENFGREHGIPVFDSTDAMLEQSMCWTPARLPTCTSKPSWQPQRRARASSARNRSPAISARQGRTKAIAATSSPVYGIWRFSGGGRAGLRHLLGIHKPA